MKYKVTFTEETPRGVNTFTRMCDVPNKNEVIKIYGLNEPDILSYIIEEYDA